ncbi:MAG: alanine glycine permease [Planctomycetaceae bacterium]|nr:alanine glycine permease [Planctomycetaceae bacterium]
MFFEIVGHADYEQDFDTALLDNDQDTEEKKSAASDLVKGLIANEVKSAGADPLELDYVIQLASDHTLSDKDIAALQESLAKEFTTGRVKTFKVVTGDGPASKVIATKTGIPIVVLWLVLGAVFFTLRMCFINFRGFKHAIMVTAGKFDNHDDDEDDGQISHFQALTAALSATVGLGNIAGVAIAVSVGGPGATFWMVVAGLLGMTSKFTECTLGQKYREVRQDGKIMGGAMYYLSKGLGEMGLGCLGQFLAILFACLCVFASFGGGNAFQVNQSLNAVSESVPFLADNRWIYGLVMTGLVAVVILGGITRIAATAEKIVPFMCGVYVLACLWILGSNAAAIPGAVGMIVQDAFTPQAGYGALLGVLVQGFRRAAFSNEAGVGSAAIAHSAAKTEYPVREGIVALLEPFIDTVVVCTMTALVIVITGAYDGNANPQYAELIASNNGAGLTSKAMGEEISWFPFVLSVAVFMFAYSTMISWSYYGERCWVYLFGDRSSLAYRIIFLNFVFLGSIMSATNVLDLSDLMILGMAFPNILGVALLSGKVKRDLDEYWAKLKNGEFTQAAPTMEGAGDE